MRKKSIILIAAASIPELAGCQQLNIEYKEQRMPICEAEDCITDERRSRILEWT